MQDRLPFPATLMDNLAAGVWRATSLDNVERIGKQHDRRPAARTQTVDLCPRLVGLVKAGSAGRIHRWIVGGGATRFTVRTLSNDRFRERRQMCAIDRTNVTAGRLPECGQIDRARIEL